MIYFLIAWCIGAWAAGTAFVWFHLDADERLSEHDDFDMGVCLVAAPVVIPIFAVSALVLTAPMLPIMLIKFVRNRTLERGGRA